MEIKPIETIYKGIKFRSRLEARWAVFFDACGVEWEYEPEGFKLPDGTCYLPDFKLKNVHLHSIDKWGERGDLWIEVKGELTDEDINKVSQFCDPQYKDNLLTTNGRPTLIVGRLPRGTTPKELITDMIDMYSGHMWSFLYIDGDDYNCVLAMDNGLSVIGHSESWYDVDMERTFECYQKANQARFEHGEKPL